MMLMLKESEGILLEILYISMLLIYSHIDI